MSIDHRVEAVSLLAASRDNTSTTFEGHNPEADRLVAEAQVHATLARDEEQAARTADLRDAITLLRRREYAMRTWVSGHIAHGLVSGDTDRWKAARELALGLDSADVNIDDLVDQHLADDGYDSKAAWASPYQAGKSDDPWAAKADVVADIPEPVRRILAGQLAEMLLDPTAGEVHQWARGIAYELKREGADLTEDIKKRITDLTLGPDPSEPPF